MASAHSVRHASLVPATALPRRSVDAGQPSWLVALLDWTIQAVVWVSTGRDFNIWSILNSLGRASAAFIGDPKVTIIMLTIQGIAIAGLVALRRLLGSDREFVE